MTTEEFFTRIKVFDYQGLIQEELSEDQACFLEAIQCLDSTNKQKALELLTRLYKSQDSKPISDQAGRLLFQQLFWADDMSAIEALGLDQAPAVDPSYRMMAEFLIKSPQKNHGYHQESHQGRLDLSISGSPIIKVECNGVYRDFWLDTGALISVVSEETAHLCGIEASAQDLTVESSTDETMASQLGLVSNLKVGNLWLKNTPAILLPNQALTIDDPSLEAPIKIDGILGWDAIKHMDLKLDYQKKTYKISKPIINENILSNIMMDGYVVVRLRSKDQKLLYFGLDTGANKTSFCKPLLQKISVDNLITEKKKIAGVGGFRDVESSILENLELHLPNKALSFEKIANAHFKPGDFFDLDGVLGSDISKFGILSIDFTNGVFDLK